MTSRWAEDNFIANNMPYNMGGAPVPPLMPPMLPGIMDDINAVPIMPPGLPMPGPQAMPPGMNQDVGEGNMDVVVLEDDQNHSGNSSRDRGSRSRQGRDSRPSDSRGQDRPRRRSRSPRDRHSRDRNQDRGDRRDRNRGERRSKWDSADRNGSQSTTDAIGVPGGMHRGITTMQGMPGALHSSVMPNMMMTVQGTPGGMMQYPASMYNNNMMGQQQMDMQTNMIGQQQMDMQPNMMGMQNMMGMPNMMMDQAMMGQMYPMNQMMGGTMPNQPIYLTNAALLPPLPGTSLPERRDRPPGCRTIFIGGLPENISEETLSEIFQRFGSISDLKLSRKGFCHVRFELHDSVEASFCLSGFRFKYQDQMDNEAINIFVDYALNRDDQNEFEKMKRNRSATPPRIEPFNPANLNMIGDKIKSEDKFAEAAPTLAGWLERGECNKKNANIFYSLIQATNNQVRRLFNEKMVVDEEFSTMKSTMREKFLHIITQFEQVSKILTVAKIQRVWDHFSKQQRRNIEMWQKMNLEVDNLKDEFNLYFDDEEEKPGKKMVAEEKYEDLKRDNETLAYELEGYKNEALVARDEAERKFEKFKAHFIAQQALQGHKPVFPPMPPPPKSQPQPPPPCPDDYKVHVTGPSVAPTEARLISVITAFLLVHPLGASVDYIVSYVRSMMPKTNQATISDILHKYTDVFEKKTSGVGASIEHRWTYITYDNIKLGA